MKPNVVPGLLRGAICLACLTGCDQISSPGPSVLEPWRAQTVLGEPTALDTGRRDGPVLPARQSQTRAGTIYGGASPLRRDPIIAPGGGGGQVTLNLVQVSIADAAEAVLAGLFGENFVIDPRVEGTVDIRSARPIGRRTALEVFELALKQNGAALVRRGELYAIVPIGTDLGIGISTTPDIRLGYTIRAVPLRHIGAREMATILQPIAGEGIVGVDEARNILVLAGSSLDQTAWQGTINSFDVDWLGNRPVGVFPIRGRSARSVVRGLELLVDRAEGTEPLALFEVMPETNSILAVARTPEALRSVARWVRRLTQQGQNDARIYSYSMRYARASDIAAVLGEILGIKVEVAGAAPGADAAPTVSGQALQAAAVLPAGAVPAGAPGAALSPNADPGLAVEFDSLGGFAEEGSANATRIVASEPTNTLLIHATPAEYNRVLGVLDRLDVPQRQVLVEATILEVTLNDSLRYGVQFFFEREGSDFVLTANPDSTSILPVVPGFSAIINTPVNVIVDALDDITEVNVVSSPNLMVLNNQPARLSVGATVPVAVRQAQEGLEDTDVFASEIEFRETGVIFEVTPRINSSGSVVLDINQEVSNVLEPDAETLTPTISQRLLRSSVAVDSGETVALGGLFSINRSSGRSGIPFLVDIPVAGVLFGRRTISSVRTELLVLITPRIVNDGLDARLVTRRLRERMTGFALSDAALSTAISPPPLETSNSRRLDAPADVRDPAPPARAAVDPIDAQPLPAPKPAATATAGSAVVVLGTFRDAQGPQRQWSALTAEKGPLLAGLSPVFDTEDGFYRLLIGPFPQRRAEDLCRSLGTDCYTE